MLPVRRLLILATYLFAFIAVIQIFYHEAGMSNDWKSNYKKKILRGTNYLRNKLSALQEKAKDLIHDVMHALILPLGTITSLLLILLFTI
jgi:hypothetical protein